jgi:hypothetical protein
VIRLSEGLDVSLRMGKLPGGPTQPKAYLLTHRLYALFADIGQRAYRTFTFFCTDRSKATVPETAVHADDFYYLKDVGLETRERRI